MYLTYKEITKYESVNQQIKNQGYGRYSMSRDDVAGLKVQQFTLTKIAAEHSRINLDQILETGLKYNVPTVIVKPQLIQFIGHDTFIESSHILDAKAIKRFTDDDTFGRWANGPKWRDVTSSNGYHMLELGGYFQHFWAMSPQCGYYQLNHLGTDYNKTTNRKTQIQELWNWGWPARRGRPVHVGFEQHSGNCQEIEMLTDMAEVLCERQRYSEVAKRTLANFRSINREYSWPGYW